VTSGRIMVEDKFTIVVEVLYIIYIYIYIYTRSVACECACSVFVLRGMRPAGAILFILKVSRRVCRQLDWRGTGVHIKKRKIQCVAVVVVGLDLSCEKSRRDTQTNLLLNGWNSITHAAHTILCVRPSPKRPST